MNEFGDKQQNIRIGFGVFKVLSLAAVFMFLPRYFIHGRDVKRAVRLTASARLAVGLGTAGMIAMVLWMFVIGPAVVGMFKADATAAQKNVLPILAVMVLGFPLQSKMNAWMARVFDDTPLSVHENKALNKAMMGGALVTIASVLPLMVGHYYLNTLAMGGSALALFVLLTLDSVVIGALAALMGAAFYVVYRDVRKTA